MLKASHIPSPLHVEITLTATTLLSTEQLQDQVK